jgi:hypothetical protein
MLIKTNEDGYVRDPESGALINNSAASYRMYKQQRESQTTVATLTKEVDSLKNDISDIKSMLSVLIKQNSKEM